MYILHNVNKLFFKKKHLHLYVALGKKNPILQLIQKKILAE